jgi:hypothetical protein
LLLHNAAAFLQVLAAAEVSLPEHAMGASLGSQPGERALLALLDLWLDRFDTIGQPQARKLNALAMCVLLTLPLPSVLARLELIAGCLTAVWFEVSALYCMPALCAEVACTT